LNFLCVIIYRTTKPKLNTSDLNALFPTVLDPWTLRSSGAKKGTVPKIVAYSKLYFDTTLLLPTSQSLIANVFEFITKIF
jgi:hypothetical protein